MARVTRFDLQAEDHFERLFLLFDLLEDKGVTGKVGEVLHFLDDSLPAGTASIFSALRRNRPTRSGSRPASTAKSSSA